MSPDDRIVADGVLVGRIVWPCAVPFVDAESHGIEIALPRETWLALMLQDNWRSPDDAALLAVAESR